MYCEKCGSSVSEGAQFCPSCGAAVVASQAPVVGNNAPPPPPQPQPQQAPPRPVATKTSEFPSVFESKKLGIALIVTSIIWWILGWALFALSIIPLGLLPAIVLVVVGIQEIRWSRETRVGNGMVGFADVALAASLLLYDLGILGYLFHLFNEWFRYGGWLSQIYDNFVAFIILGPIALVITVVLFILAFISRKKAGQRTRPLRVVLLLLAVTIVFSIPFIVMPADYFGGSADALYMILTVLAESILLAALITRAVDLFPRHQRVARAVGAPTGGSVATANPLDAPSVGFAVLCFFMPLVGLILYLVWKSEYPLKAKSCGKGALIGAIVIFGLSCLLTVLMIAVPLLLVL
jgi:hypothetical protein